MGLCCVSHLAQDFFLPSENDIGLSESNYTQHVINQIWMNKYAY